jgi:hypothetical protein
MINPFPIEDPDLDAAIASAHSNLKKFSAEDDGYQKAVDQLSKLYKLKHDQSKLNLELHQSQLKNDLDQAELAQKREEACDKLELEREKEDFQNEQDSRPFYERVSPDVVLTVLGNLLIGLIVVKYEQTGVISSKFTQFMKKI